MKASPQLTAFIDQLLAALAAGDLSTERLAVEVGTIYCCCDVCGGEGRAATVDDVFPVMKRLAWYGIVTGSVERSCMESSGGTVMWHREMRVRWVGDHDDVGI